MDSTLISTLIICLLSLVQTHPVGFIGVPHDPSGQEGAGSLWHVFRQVHASEVASRQLLSSSRTPSSKVAETTRIITKEERGRSYEPSFTIISRIKSPVEQMLALLPPRPSWTPNFLGRRTEAIPIRKEETPSSRTSSFNGHHSAWSPPHNASNLIIIGEAEPVIDDERHVETSRKYGGLFTVEKGLVRYRSSQPAEEGNLSGNGHYSGPESPVTFGLWEMMKTRRPQKWDALNKLLPSRSTTEREEPAATQPTTTTSTAHPLSWNAYDSGNHDSRLENDDSVLVTDISSRTEEKGSSTIFPATPATGSSQQQLPDATGAANRNGSQSEEESDSIRTTPQPTAPHQFNNSWLVVRVDDSTCYAATDSFANNGTIVFKRFQSAGLDQSGWSDLSDIENYYPGFGQVAGTKPGRLIVRTTIVANEDEPLLSEQEHYLTTPQSVNSMVGLETVSIVPSNSSLFTEEIIAFHNESKEANAVPHHFEPLNSVFRKVDDDKPAVNSVEPSSGNNDDADLTVNLAAPAYVSNVTTMPTSSTEEQMTPPLLKTLENLLLTHLLAPITSSSAMSSPVSSSSLPSNSTSLSTSSYSTTTSSYNFTSATRLTSSINTTPTTTSTSSTASSTTSSTASPSTESYFPWVLHHSEPVQSINDWSIVSQLIEPAQMPSTYSTSPSTTVLPEKVIQSPAHYDPAINKGTLSSHTVIIPSRNPSLAQQLAPSYPLRKSALVPEFSSDKPSSASSIQMFTLKPEVEAPKIVTGKPASKKNTGLASLILAHTSALMSGQNSPFFNDVRRSSNSSSDVRQTKTKSIFLPEPLPITATVHVIMASPYPDPEHEEELNRRRSLDSRVGNNNQNAIITGNSSWAFPSFSQLIESPDLLLTKNSSSLIRAVNASPVSSFNGNTNDDLPSLPRFSCGNQSSSDELVITNPNYPNPDDDAGNCGFRLLVNSHHVCQIRVEFRESRMLLPRKGNCLHQYLTVSESSTERLKSPVVEKKFCGFNSDQHFYVELAQSGNANNLRHVDFKINTKAAGFPYRYSMIVSQINCDLPSPNKAPTGCFQYFNTRAGVIKSFNFEGGQYWNNQNYRICVKSIDSSCTLALSSTEGDFGIYKARSRSVPANRAGVGKKACPRDYLWIPGTTQSEERHLSNDTHDRYCGTKFSERRGDFRHRIVMARMSNSVHMMIFHTGASRHYHGPGFRIDFEQMSVCPSQSTLNNYSYASNANINGTDSALADADYYDESDDDKELV